MDNPARTSDDRLDRVLRDALPGEFSFFGRQQEQPPSLPTALEPGRVIGDFRLIALIGQGGMGQVWEAEQTTLERRVALKLVRPDRVNEHTLDLFAREARAGGRLHHPGIVTVHGHGEHEGLAWISMELVEGSWTLHDFLQDAGKKDELPGDYYPQVAEFMARLAEALHTAHEAGVIHRDLKPRNVLITSDEQPKVSDFGLAKITDETAISQTGEFAGTYYYMSPEQAMAKRMGIDHRTDIFSLGVVMYEMLALRRPFEGDTTQQIVRQIMLEDPVDPRRLRSRVPRDLAVISGKCLEKHPDRRYQTMAELAADIRRHLAHEPILAKPPTAWQRGVKWLQRHPTTSGIAGVGTAALVVISFLLAANVRANEDLRTASETITRERNNLAAANEELETERNNLAAANEELETERNNLSTEVESVKRLSALQDHDDLMAEVDELWPPYPESIDANRKWIAETQELVDELPLHHAKREELRAMALPQSAGEREAEREQHPDFPRLEALAGEIAARRRALEQRRDGVRAELPELDFGSLPQDPAKLNALAWPLVDPEREVFGREAEGLVLANKALELAQAAQDDALVATVGDTVSRAFFAVGRDEKALEASGAALEMAPEEKREEYEGHLSDLEGWVEKQRSEEGAQIAEEELAQLAAEREELQVRVNERQVWDFPDTEEGREARWWHANLTKLIEALEALTAAGTGLLSDAQGAVSAEQGWSVVRRLAFAQRLSAGFAPGGEFRVRWEQDLPGIREAYPGLELDAQLGLVPIGADPESKLWEFWHVQSGTEPLRGADGKLVMEESSGLVLVLLPGGTFWMGAQSSDPQKPNYDPQAVGDEGPVHEVELSAFLLSKYEMTQGQWKRFAGRNPSRDGPDGQSGRSRNSAGLAATLLEPVEQVSWTDCMRELERLGLALPSEAQWEYGARGGAQTAWWSGAEQESLAGVANLADLYARDHGGSQWSGIEEWLSDGYTSHAPVDTLLANPFGLHHVHGNVWEWCLDGYEAIFYGQSPGLDPVSPHTGSVDRVYRGGGFFNAASSARSAYRYGDTPEYRNANLGLRPAKGITP